MSDKINILFLCSLVSLIPSSALRGACNFEGNVAPDAIKGAVCVGSVLKENYGLVKKFPATYKFLQNVVKQGTALIDKDPVFFAAWIFVTGIKVILTSYYLSIDSKKKLMEAQFEHDELDMLIETEILPLFEVIEKVLIEGKGSSKTEMKLFCNGENSFIGKLDRAIANLRTARKNIERKMIDDSDDVAMRIWKYFFGNNHQAVYSQARSDAFTAEKYLREARTNIDLACMHIMKESTLTEWVWEGIHLLKTYLTRRLRGKSSYRVGITRDEL